MSERTGLAADRLGRRRLVLAPPSRLGHLELQPETRSAVKQEILRGAGPGREGKEATFLPDKSVKGSRLRKTQRTLSGILQSFDCYRDAPKVQTVSRRAGFEWDPRKEVDGPFSRPGFPVEFELSN